MSFLRVSSVLAVSGIAFAVACSNDNTMTEMDATPPTPVGDAGPCPGQTVCDGKCVVTKRDPENCGMCGKKCKEGEVCVQGGCALQCGGGSTKCNSVCVSTQADPANCGMCGNKCVA